MAKQPQPATETQADTETGLRVSFALKNRFATIGLGVRGDRRAMEGEARLDWSRVPENILEFLLLEGAESEAHTASTAAERGHAKLLKEGKVQEAANYDIAAEAVRFMQERFEQWYQGNPGRTRGMTDPVEARAQKIATDRFIGLVAAGKVRNVPPNTKLTAEQKTFGRDLLLEKQGDAIRKLAREQLAEEARRAKEAAQVGEEFELSL